MYNIIGLIALLLVVSTSALYSPSGLVVELTPSNFDTLVLNGDEVWVVEFYAPWCGHCKSLVPEYQKAAKALKGVVKVGAVNADDHKSLGAKYDVKGFPTIKIFGSNKKTPVDFNGQRTASAIIDAALQDVSKKVKNSAGGGGSESSDDVITLTDSNFDKLVLNSDEPWLVEFFAPWCGHCKNLEPHWRKAAAELKGKVKVGALDATVHSSKTQEYGVQGYPTIKFFPGGKKRSSDVVDYDGGRTSSDIVTWALEKYSDNIPAPELVQVTDEKTFKQHCEDKPLCIFSALPHILDCDAKCRNAFLDILKDMGEKYKKKMWGWVWAEGGTQTKLEESLEIGGFGYPAMVVANFKKMKFSSLRGSFSKVGINEFLRDISFGRGHTIPLKGGVVPTISSIEPWDGKDGQLPVEEELDLSDIDLDDKDEL